ncbi:DMT family transporter [Halobacillus salinarum]|uniref:DMT family transporter n=1 Tax=Halobacillus salinarum TaxID=2932257 RepID=A0ABY4EN85_9BACI|nr:DMT family transporter [Halobacillus salinarum]UOQ45922.1 DMT family transporter [Halobacillus salinarum]
MYPYFLMIFVVIFYAGNILVGKALNDLPPFTIAFFRLLVAFMILMPIGLRTAWKKRLTFKEHKGPLFVLTLTGITFFNMFVYGALQFTTATNVSVLETIIPVVTVILSTGLIKEKLQRIQWLGIFLSFFGAVWVILDGRFLKLASLTWNIGDGIMMGAVISWAVYSVCVKQYMHLFPPYAVLLVMTGISVLLLMPVVVMEWWWLGVPAWNTPDHIAGFLYLGIFPSFFALVFYNRAVELLNPSQAAIFLNFLPVVTLYGAYLWLGEAITFMKVMGALVVIGGVLLTTQFKRKRSQVNDSPKKH